MTSTSLYQQSIYARPRPTLTELAAQSKAAGVDSDMIANAVTDAKREASNGHDPADTFAEALAVAGVTA